MLKHLTFLRAKVHILQWLMFCCPYKFCLREYEHCPLVSPSCRPSCPCCCWAIRRTWGRGSSSSPSAARFPSRIRSPPGSSAPPSGGAKSWAWATPTWNTFRPMPSSMWVETWTIMETLWLILRRTQIMSGVSFSQYGNSGGPLLNLVSNCILFTFLIVIFSCLFPDA